PIPLAVEWPLQLADGRVAVAVHGDVDEADGLPGRRAAGSGDAGHAEPDLRAEALARAAGERPRDDGGDRAVAVDEVGGDAGEDRLRLVRVHHGAAPEVVAGPAVGGQDRREEAAGARLRRRDREPAAPQRSTVASSQASPPRTKTFTTAAV